MNIIYPEKNGFTLLYSILVIGILLSIVFAILNISYKQITLSGAARDSQVAFYMADTGAECAKYWDQKGSFSATTTRSGQDAQPKFISCGERTDIKVGGRYGVINNNEQTSTVNCPGSTEQCALSSFTLTYSATGQPNKDVKVNLYKNSNTGETILESTGHNIADSNNPRQVERAVKLVYTPTGEKYCDGDVMVLLDTSKSVSDSNNMQNLADKAVYLVNNLFTLKDNNGQSLPNNNIKVGLVTFGDSAKTASTTTNISDIGLTDVSGKQRLIKYINSNKVKGYRSYEGTNLAAGLAMAQTEFDGGVNTNQNTTVFRDSGVLQNPKRDRDNTAHPNFIFILTDGAPHGQIHPDGSIETNNPAWTTGSTNVLDQTTSYVNSLKDSTAATIFLIGIGLDNPQDSCTGYSKCSDYLKQAIIGPPTNKFTSISASIPEYLNNYIVSADDFEDSLTQAIDKVAAICQ